MKKRSLFAAVAMLIVSAVVLTSATYAWFASGSKADISNISASITNNDGTLQIASTNSGAANANWGYHLDLTDFPAQTNLTSSTLIPVSFDVNAGTIVDGQILQDTTDNTKYNFSTTGTAQTSGYIHLTFWVRASKACTVTVTPNLSSQSRFIYCAATSTGATNSPDIQGGTNAAGYTAITQTGGTRTCEDANKDYIVNAAEDTNSNLLGNSVALSQNHMQLTFSAAEATALTAKQVEVYLWAEGNDPGCTGDVQTASATLSIDLAME